MIPTLKTTSIIFAIIAMTSQFGLAASPQKTNESQAKQQSSIQQTGHSCPSAACCDSDCCDDNCCDDGCCNAACCRNGYCDGSCGGKGKCRFGGCKKGCKCRRCRVTLLDRLRCRNIFNFGMGYNDCDGSGRFGPKGCGGKGCPPFGVYQMVYPVNPDYCDYRNGSVHAAQGYGVPMSVPLAPVVRHQYNYSWGVPASRITHISNHAPHLMQGPNVVYGLNATKYMGADHFNYCPQCQQNAAGY